MIGIINYGLGNIQAFANIYKKLDVEHKIVSSKEDLLDVDKIILPGVGAFDHAMTQLNNSGMREELDDMVLNKKVPVIGICVGMQMLAKSSDEGIEKGLGWIDGVVKEFDSTKFNKNEPLPHMGWNRLTHLRKNNIIYNIIENSRFYFLHSYYFKCNNQDDIVSNSYYGEKFNTIINHKNIYGIQCHPEKSHNNGIQILKNFANIDVEKSKFTIVPTFKKTSLSPRVIPCLLVHNKGLVKTVKFKEGKYVGDPINAVKIFNEKEVDELIVLDIDATIENREPDYKMIENLATECRMPFCYGGGIKTVKQALKIFSLGVEKIAISSIAIENPILITEIAKRVGNQSVVVVIDIKKRVLGNKYDIYTHNGKQKHKLDLFKFIKKLEELGVGEVVINSIDNDGVMKGYDFSLVSKIRKKIKVPMSVVGGAGSLNDISKLIKDNGIIGAVAGSLFVFKGVYKAVLINYPQPKDKEKLINLQD